MLMKDDVRVALAASIVDRVAGKRQTVSEVLTDCKCHV